MKAQFVATMRQESKSSLVITIPKEVRKMMDLKKGQTKQFHIEDEDET